MRETILFGRGRQVAEMSREEWEERLSEVPRLQEARLRFMSEEHHRVRYLVVRDLARTGRPIPPDYISRELGLSRAQTDMVLDDLEEKLFFIVRDARGDVSWAFPVTVDQTPHQLSFSTGERLYAA